MKTASLLKYCSYASFFESLYVKILVARLIFQNLLLAPLQHPKVCDPAMCEAQEMRPLRLREYPPLPFRNFGPSAPPKIMRNLSRSRCNREDMDGRWRSHPRDHGAAFRISKGGQSIPIMHLSQYPIKLLRRTKLTKPFVIP